MWREQEEEDSLFSRWAADLQLNIYISKCSVLHLGRKYLTYDYALDGVTLPNVREMRDFIFLVTLYAQIAAKAHLFSELD